MSSAADKVTGVFAEGQDLLVQAVKTWQESVTNAANAMAQNVARLGDNVPTGGANNAVSSAVVDNVFDFAEQLLATQRQFAKSLIASSGPAVEAANTSARTAADAAVQAAKDSAQVVKDAANKATDATVTAAKNGKTS